MTIGDKIRFFRKARGWTQKQLATQAGVAEISIRNYENSKRQPKISMLRKIAAALSVNLWDITEFDSPIEVDEEAPVTMPEVFTKEKRRAELIANFEKLNIVGQMKAVDTMADFAEIPKYREEGE